MERRKIKTEYKRTEVKPKYVWITCGTGKYTNPETAEVLAKRSAGIENLYTQPIHKIIPSPFTLLDKREFLEKLSPGKTVYAYGWTEITKDDVGSLCGCISTMTTDKWGGISFSVRQSSNVEKATLTSTRDLVYNYGGMFKDIAPTPTSVSCSITADDPASYALVVMALILEDDDE